MKSPRTPLPRISKKRLAANGGKTPFLKRSAIRKKPRKPSETLRIYGPPARRKWMKTLPCSACGIVGYSEGAHVLGNGGMSRKADADTQAPLCGFHVQTYFGTWPTNNYGCHTMFDEYPEEFAYKFPDFDPVKAAADCEAAWLAFSGIPERGVKK